MTNLHRTVLTGKVIGSGTGKAGPTLYFNFKTSPRFAGSNFNQMLDHPPGTDHCGALYTGWLQSDHPSVDEGLQPGKVCFQTGSLLDCGMETSTHIVNCGDFFIYYLPDAPECNLRYCGM